MIGQVQHAIIERWGWTNDWGRDVYRASEPIDVFWEKLEKLVKQTREAVINTVIIYANLATLAR